MKRDTINYFAVGSFVLAMGVAFLILLYLITGRQGPSDIYFLEFENVAGIKYGTGVFYEGYRVGQVEKIVPESGPGGVHYRLEVTVRKGWQIPVDSVAQVVAAGLIAAVNIDIQQGAADAFLEPGSVIPSQARANLFATLGDAAADFRELSQNGLKPVLATLDSRINEVADELVALRREDLSPLISDIDRNLNGEIFVKLDAVLDKLDGAVATADAVLSDGNRRRVDSLLRDLQQTAAGLNQLVTGVDSTRTQLEGVMTRVDGLVESNAEQIDRTLENLAQASRGLNHTSQIVAEEIDTIVYHLSSTSRNMNEFARAIRENPSRVIRSAPAPESEAP